MLLRLFFIGMAALMFLSVGVSGRADSYNRDMQAENDLTALSLEDLMAIEITSVAKKPQKVSDAAAAIFVITQEDIRRSGVTSIPEALRMVPGLQVARIYSNTWAISSRGFNGRIANKLLVLIDGRSAYTPLFSGVFWEVQDTLLEDIDRIEVIRGPGATLWGANAVNGVINIITKKAKDTRGSLVTAGFGTEEKGFGGVRYGGKLGETGDYYRVYAKYFNRDEAVFASGPDAADDWNAFRGGFRMDLSRQPDDLLTLQGDIYDGDSGLTMTDVIPVSPYSAIFDSDIDFIGGNLNARWQHTISSTSDLTLQLYYDRAEYQTAIIGQDIDTADIDFQHRFGLPGNHEIMWGLGYRFIHDDISSSFSTVVDPASRDYDLLNAFVQDEITLFPDLLRVTVGSKFEYNDSTGFEFQPSARLWWKPHERQTVWAAISRAVRTPCRAEEDVRITRQVLPSNTLGSASTMGFLTMVGSREFESEDLLASELGYRFETTKSVSVDMTAFYNIYDNLLTLEPGTLYLETADGSPHFVLPIIVANKMDGKTYGMELTLDWHPLHWWRVQGAYTWLQMQLHPDEDSGDTFSEKAEDESPHHQVSLRSLMNLTKNLELDVWARYVDELSGQGVDRYVTLDCRLGWEPVRNLELSIVGQNLLDSQHSEFNEELFVNSLSTEIERGVYGRITMRF